MSLYSVTFHIILFHVLIFIKFTIADTQDKSLLYKLIHKVGNHVTAS
jgi:hypothetical protein